MKQYSIVFFKNKQRQELKINAVSTAQALRLIKNLNIVGVLVKESK